MSYTYNFLGLTNRLCQRLNEVELDSSTFATANGVYADFKNAINAAVLDIYQEEDNEWPFGWSSTSFVTTIGQNEYTKDADAVSIDWDSFYIKRAPLTVASITQSSGTATVTVSAGHQLITGDSVYITGADQADYNGTFTATVTSATEFTISVSASAVSPATGTIIMYPPYTSKKLELMDWDTYRKEGRLVQDLEMYKDTSFSVPEVVVRKPDNNFIISPKPRRKYTIVYEKYSMPSDMTTYTDVPSIPEEFKEVIIDGAMVHGYFFRDNIEQTAKIEDTYRNGVNRMRRILIPQTGYARVVN